MTSGYKSVNVVRERESERSKTNEMMLIKAEEILNEKTKRDRFARQCERKRRIEDRSTINKNYFFFSLLLSPYI